MIELWPDQQQVYIQARGRRAAGCKSLLVVCPTGWGKTVWFSFLAQNALAKGGTVVIVVHRAELLDQVSQTLGKFAVPHSYIAPGYPYDPHARIHIASAFALARRLENIAEPSVLIVDEAHHAIGGSTWGHIIKAWQTAYLVGVTATPARLSGEGLGDMFQEMLVGPSVSEMIRAGRLSDYKLFAPSSVDLRGVPIRGGDYVGGELAKRVDKPTVTGDAVSEYRTKAHGKRAVAFCVSVEHAKNVAAQFSAAGYSATAVDGKMERSFRSNIIDRFRRGQIQILTSCDLISEGFDLPAIECGIFLRPTMSLRLWLQQAGRCLRSFPGKQYALLLDHANNCRTHGLPDDERTWTLEGRDKSRRKTAVPVRQCPFCYAVVPAAAQSCRYCQRTFAVSPREVKQVAGTLSEVDRIRDEWAADQSFRTARDNATTTTELIAIGLARGMKNPSGWAWHVMNERARKRRPVIHPLKV